jgi:hypothetical protein
LEIYYNDKGQYPASNASGKIMGCGAGAITECDWGSPTVPFSNTTTGTVYIMKLPADPSESFNYYYTATQAQGLYTKYRLYAHLENTQDKNILETITYDTQCGETCNYGISSGNTTP